MSLPLPLPFGLYMFVFHVCESVSISYIDSLVLFLDSTYTDITQYQSSLSAYFTKRYVLWAHLVAADGRILFFFMVAVLCICKPVLFVSVGKKTFLISFLAECSKQKELFAKAKPLSKAIK